MMELLVTGSNPAQQWKREIPSEEVVRVGRAPRVGWAVPWDLLISREHFELSLDGNQLNVRRLETGRNPMYFQEVDTQEFVIGAGQSFRIGTTLFQLISVDVVDGVSGSHIEEHSFARETLRTFKFRNAEHRLELLTRLPKAISKAANNEELAQSAIKILLDSMKHARAVACVHYAPNATVEDKPLMMRWDSRHEDLGRFFPQAAGFCLQPLNVAKESCTSGRRTKVPIRRSPSVATLTGPSACPSKERHPSAGRFMSQGSSAGQMPQM